MLYIVTFTTAIHCFGSLYSRHMVYIQPSLSIVLVIEDAIQFTFSS